MTVAGLTFQTAADARAFDKGVKLAVEDIHAGQKPITSTSYALHTSIRVDKVTPYAMCIFLHAMDQDGYTAIDAIPSDCFKMMIMIMKMEEPS